MSIGRVPGTSGISPTIVDAKGDLIAATAADSVSRLVVGADETRLVAASGEATGLKYVADTTNYAIAAKGDLLAGTAADTVSALTVGANNTVLTADSSTATGLKWAAVAAGANWSLLNAGGTALTGATTVTVSGISAKDKIAVAISGASAGASSVISIRFNGDTANNYNFGCEPYFGSTVSAGSYVTNYDRIVMADLSSNAASDLDGFLIISGANASGLKIGHKAAAGSASGGSGQTGSVSFVNYAGTSTISSVSVVSSSGNLDAGTVYVYTSA